MSEIRPETIAETHRIFEEIKEHTRLFKVQKAKAEPYQQKILDVMREQERHLDGGGNTDGSVYWSRLEAKIQLYRDIIEQILEIRPQ